MHKSGIRHTIQQQKILVPIQREFGGVHGKVVPGDKSTITCRHGRVRKGNRFVGVVYRLHRVGSGLRHKIESTCVLALQHTLEFGAPTSAVDAKGVLYIDPSTCCSTWGRICHRRGREHNPYHNPYKWSKHQELGVILHCWNFSAASSPKNQQHPHLFLIPTSTILPSSRFGPTWFLLCYSHSNLHSHTASWFSGDLGLKKPVRSRYITLNTEVKIESYINSWTSEWITISTDFWGKVEFSSKGPLRIRKVLPKVRLFSEPGLAMTQLIPLLAFCVDLNLTTLP